MTLAILKTETQSKTPLQITVQQDIQRGYFQIGVHINGVESILRTDTPADLRKIASLFDMAAEAMIRHHRLAVSRIRPGAA